MIDATVQPQAQGKTRRLSPRILSALVLAPPVLAAIWCGGLYVSLLVVVAGGLLAWEWSRLCGPVHLPGLVAPGFVAPGLVVTGSVVLALVAGSLSYFDVAAWIAAAGAMAAAVLGGKSAPNRPLRHALGVIYLAPTCLAFLWLRQEVPQGRDLVLWLLLVVWATDTGAFCFGKMIGGPKLVPAFSPNKTWAGLLGGMACAAIVGLLFSVFRQDQGMAFLAVASALLAVVAQAGDVLESAMKRYFGVKDSSRLIPGHGGLMDRVDGLLAVSLFVALLLWSARFAG